MKVESLQWITSPFNQVCEILFMQTPMHSLNYKGVLGKYVIQTCPLNLRNLTLLCISLYVHENLMKENVLCGPVV